MARYNVNLSKFDYIDFNATTLPTGRTYHTPAGDAPSVTTILSTLPNPELDAWRERVGNEEADRISREATDIGTLMHDSLEALLLGEEYVPNPECNPDVHLKTAMSMAKAIRMIGWRKLDEVWGVEVPLHYENLYAGRTDLIGVYNRKRSIMDYKTSKFPKPPKHLIKYKLQMAAYKVAHEWMYPEETFEQGILFFAMRPNPEFRKSAQSQVIVVEEKELNSFAGQWIEILEDFYA